jgi:hypothetical protein
VYLPNQASQAGRRGSTSPCCGTRPGSAFSASKAWKCLKRLTPHLRYVDPLAGDRHDVMPSRRGLYLHRKSVHDTPGWFFRFDCLLRWGRRLDRRGMVFATCGIYRASSWGDSGHGADSSSAAQRLPTSSNSKASRQMVSAFLTGSTRLLRLTVHHQPNECLNGAEWRHPLL